MIIVFNESAWIIDRTAIFLSNHLIDLADSPPPKQNQRFIIDKRQGQENLKKMKSVSPQLLTKVSGTFASDEEFDEYLARQATG